MTQGILLEMLLSLMCQIRERNPTVCLIGDDDFDGHTSVAVIEREESRATYSRLV